MLVDFDLLEWDRFLVKFSRVLFLLPNLVVFEYSFKVVLLSKTIVIPEPSITELSFLFFYF